MNNSSSSSMIKDQQSAITTAALLSTQLQFTSSLNPQSISGAQDPTPSNQSIYGGGKNMPNSASSQLDILNQSKTILSSGGSVAASATGLSATGVGFNQSQYQTPPIHERYLVKSSASKNGTAFRDLSSFNLISPIDDPIQQSFHQTQRLTQGGLAKLKAQGTGSSNQVHNPDDSLNSHYFAMSSGKFNINDYQSELKELRENESPLMKIVRESQFQSGGSKVMSSNNLELITGGVSNLTIAQTTGTEPTLDMTNSQKLLQHQSFIEQQKGYGLLQPLSGQATSLPQTTDHRNVTLNSQQMNGQLPFRVKQLPKKSRSFGNPSGAIQTVLQNNLLVNGQNQMGNQNLVQVPAYSIVGGGAHNNSTFYGQKSQLLIQQQNVGQYGNKRQSADGKQHQNSVTLNPLNINNEKITHTIGGNGVFSNNASQQLMIQSTQQHQQQLTTPNLSNIANMTQNNFSIRQYQTAGVAQGEKPSAEKSIIQLGNQNNLIAKKLDIKQPIQAKDLNQTAQLNSTMSQLRPNSLGKVQTKGINQIPNENQNGKLLDPQQRNNSNNTPFSNKTTATTATSDYLREDNLQSPKMSQQLPASPQKLLPVTQNFNSSNISSSLGKPMSNPSDFYSSVYNNNNSMNLNSDQSPQSKTASLQDMPSSGAAGLGHQVMPGFQYNFLNHLNSINFKDKIMIHVIDDSKNQKRDFTFSRSLLVKYMKYFEKCLKKISENDEIDISIHCDAGIFEWLLNYIFNQEESEKQQNSQNGAMNLNTTNGWQLRVQKCDDGKTSTGSGGGFSNLFNARGPQLDQKNVVSILISADFLKIDRLVKHCMEYFVNNIEEISKIQVDMSCINSVIIREMAKSINLDRLDVLKERKDKLVSRLFMKKLELLLEKDKNYLHKCAYCLRLFTKSQRQYLSCPKGELFIDDHGQHRAKHVMDKEWDLKKFITYVRETYRISWKEIYWKVWSYLHLFKCNHCQEYFQIAELANCKYHEKGVKLQNQYGAPQGVLYHYSCCNKNLTVKQLLELEGRGLNGCKMKMHEPINEFFMSTEKERQLLNRLISHQLIILEIPPSNLIEQISLSQDASKQSSSPLKSPRSSPMKANFYKVALQSQEPQNNGTVIIKPSSLNYKISLKQGVEEYIKKESKIDDFDIQVELLKQNNNTSEPNDHQRLLQQINEEFDDVLFDMYIQVKSKATGVVVINTQTNTNPNQQNNAGAVNVVDQSTNSGSQAQSEWEKENEKMRKKLERNSINSVKYKYSQQQNNTNQQQTNQGGEQNSQEQPDPSGSQRQSPTKVKPPGSGFPANGTANNGNPQQQPQQLQLVLQAQNQNLIQLNSEQLEEAKVMTQFKMKQFKKDRLQTSDKDRMSQLQDMLKKVRLSEQQVVQLQSEQLSSTCLFSCESPKANGASSPQKKNQSIFSTMNPFQINSNQPQPNYQVMTQITSICNKRSRSTNYQAVANQNAQSPMAKQEALKNSDTAENFSNQVDRGKSPPIQLRKGEINNNISNNIEPPNLNNRSPRMTRLKNVSPPSREKLMYQGNLAIGGQQSQQEDKIVHSPTKLPNNIYQNAANSTFYQHRKTNSSKLPQINSKTVETSSLSNTYYSKE